MKIKSLVMVAIALTAGSCRQDMYNQPRTKPLSATNFFTDGTSARPVPLHTVEYHGVSSSDAFSSGLSDGLLIAYLPPPLKLTPELLQRGQERYDIYCAVCHGITGAGDGEVVRRGFPAPPTYHSDRLRNAPLGHFYDVISNGYGVMYSYASRIEPQDRWAIATYIRALQLSQHATPDDVLPNEQRKLEETQ